jgi:hypothetical protein
MDASGGLRRHRRLLLTAVLVLAPLATPLPLFGEEEGGTPP